MMTFVIRADADSKTGTGHVMRMLGFAQYWLDAGAKVLFVSNCENRMLRQRITDSGIILIDAQSSPEDPSAVNTLLAEARAAIEREQPDFLPWIVTDCYGFTADNTQAVIKKAGYPLLVVTDYSHASHYYADIILNQNLSADESLYVSREPETDLLLGPEYAILRREFHKLAGWQRSIPNVAKRILVTLGGGNSDNVSERIIRALDKAGISNIEARVLVGPANEHLHEVEAAAASCRISCNVITQPDMPEELKLADMAVLAGGITCLEAAFMGLPVMTVVLADNQVEPAKRLAGRGVTVNLGWHHELSDEKLAVQLRSFALDADLRTKCSLAGMRLVDGKGMERVARKMKTRSVRIRSAAAQDCELIFRWANEPGARAVSFNPEPIPLQDHLKWFNDRLNRDDVKLYIVTTDRGIPLGQARFEMNSGNAVISVTLDPSFRGRGFGSVLIDVACLRFSGDCAVPTVKAFIKPDNEVSKRAFHNAGFRDIGMTEIKGCKALEMQYSVGDL